MLSRASVLVHCQQEAPAVLKSRMNLLQIDMISEVLLLEAVTAEHEDRHEVRHEHLRTYLRPSDLSLMRHVACLPSG